MREDLAGGGTACPAIDLREDFHDTGDFLHFLESDGEVFIQFLDGTGENFPVQLHLTGEEIGIARHFINGTQVVGDVVFPAFL